MAFGHLSPYTEIRVLSFGGGPGFLYKYTFNNNIFVVYLHHKPSYNGKVKPDGGIFLNHKKAGYFTIGEMSRVTGIHPKSIRYYERIGAIKPAMVDPETGYRYYRPAQFNHLTAIKICIQLGILLRDFKNYYADGMLYADRYLQDAAEISQQQIRHLQNNLEFIEKIRAYIKQADLLIAAGRILEMDYPEMHFLIQEIPPDISLYALFQCYQQLQSEAFRQSLQPETLYGKIAVFRQGKLHRLYAGIQVFQHTAAHDIFTLPEASYAALFTPVSRIIQSKQIFPDQATAGQEMLVFESDVIASQYIAEAPGYILRCISR